MFSSLAKRILRLRSSFVNRFSLPDSKKIDHGSSERKSISDHDETSEERYSELPGGLRLQLIVEQSRMIFSELQSLEKLLKTKIPTSWGIDHETSKDIMPGGLKHLTNQVQSLGKLLDDKMPSAWGRIDLTLIDFHRLHKKFVVTLLKETGPYLSKKVEDFQVSPNDDLGLFWKYQPFNIFLLKLEEHLTNNPVFREAFERKGFSIDEFLSFCKRVHKGKEEGIDFVNPYEREEKIKLDDSYNEALQKYAVERKKDCSYINQILPKLEHLF